MGQSCTASSVCAVVEIAASSASYDLGDQLRAYRRDGVQEYVVWRVLDRELDWFVLREGTYDRLEPDAACVLRSEVFRCLAEVPRDVTARIEQNWAR